MNDIRVTENFRDDSWQKRSTKGPIAPRITTLPKLTSKNAQQVVLNQIYRLFKIFKFEDHETPVARVRDFMVTQVDILIESPQLLESFNTTFVNFMAIASAQLTPYDLPEQERTRDTRFKMQAVFLNLKHLKKITDTYKNYSWQSSLSEVQIKSLDESQREFCRVQAKVEAQLNWQQNRSQQRSRRTNRTLSMAAMPSFTDNKGASVGTQSIDKRMAETMLLSERKEDGLAKRLDQSKEEFPSSSRSLKGIRESASEKRKNTNDKMDKMEDEPFKTQKRFD